MDIEDDIRKIENFLEVLKSGASTETIYINSDAVERSTECYKANDFSSQTSRNGRVTQLHTILNGNEDCQKLLSYLESSLTFLLEECRKEQKIVREKIEACENKKVGERIGCGSRSMFIRKTCVSPYFKDCNGFPASRNVDVVNRRNMGYLNPWDVLNTSAWTDDQKRSLEKGIKDAEKQELKKSATNCYKVNSEITDHDISCVEKISLDELVGLKEKEYDWIKISVIDLRGARSPLECEAVWYNYLHPTINKKRWTESESETLKELVIQHNYQDWELIACDLGTGRSAYQCIGHFKIRLSDFSKVKWTDKETTVLTRYVNLFRVRYFIPWYKIAWLMDGHGSNDIYRKWVNEYADLKKGKFSLEEDILLAAGLKEFGNNWSQIAEYFPNRRSMQLRGRLLVLKGREQNFRPWAPYEDELLNDLVQKYGFGNWTKISSHFLYRNKVQIRTRYRSLLRWKQKTGSDSILRPVETRTPRTASREKSLDSLWETAKKIVKAKQSKSEFSTVNKPTDVKLISQLSKILKPRRKPGRKKGTVNFPSFHEQFYKYFHVAHSQRGGRGKETCTKEKIPSLVYHILLALRLLDAKVCLPSQNESLHKDHMLEMDKSIVIFLINRKNLIEDKCTFIQFEDSPSLLDKSSNTSNCSESPVSCEETSSEWYPVCSPCITTLIGLRTMLLNRTNVKGQSKGFTVQNTKFNSDSLNPGQFSINIHKYRRACQLWNRRIGVLYTWAAFLSKMYPHDQFVIDPTNNSDDMLSEEPASKKRRSRKKKRVKDNADGDEHIEAGKSGDATMEGKQKRGYVKSGKFSFKTKFSGCTRRSTRHTKAES